MNRNHSGFFVRCWSGKGELGVNRLLLFVGKMKIGGAFLVSLSPFLVLTQEKETKESQAPAGSVFFVRRWSGKGCLGGGVLLLFIGKMKIGGVWVQIFLCDGEWVTILIRSASDMSIRRAYAIRPYLNGRKIATFLIRSAHNDQKIAMILIRLPHSNRKNAQIFIHRQKMIPKPIEASYPWAIRKVNPDAYTFLFVQKKRLRDA